MSKKRKIVEVTWEDSASHGDGWKPLSAINFSTVTCVSIGHIYKRTGKQLHLAPHIVGVGPDQHGFGTLSIPTSAIRKIRRLR